MEERRGDSREETLRISPALGGGCLWMGGQGRGWEMASRLGDSPEEGDGNRRSAACTLRAREVK